MLLTNCKTSKQAKSYNFPVVMEATENTEQDVIGIRCSATGTTESEAVNSAENKAMTSLLFQGIASSKQPTALVGDEKQSRKMNNKFFENFFENTNFRKFITSSFNYNGVINRDGVYYVVRDIQINLRALRTHLENNQIIRKFGY